MLRASPGAATTNVISIQTKGLNPGNYVAATQFVLNLDLDHMIVSRCVADSCENRPPRLSALGELCVTEGQWLSVPVRATDPNGDPVVIDFSAPTLPDNAEFDGIAFNWQVEPGTVGNSYEVVFTATDDGAPPLSDTGTMTLTVVPEPNLPPTLQPIGDQSIRAGEPLSFTVSGSDPAGDSLTFSHSGLPAGATLVQQGTNMAVFSWTPSTEGTYEVTFTVTDGCSSDAESIRIDVISPNRAPVFKSTGSQCVAEGSSLVFNVQAKDPDGDDVIVTLAGHDLPSQPSFDGVQFSWSSDLGTAGSSYTVTFQAQEDRTTALTTEMTVTIHISSGGNQKPALNPIYNQSVKAEQLLEFAVSATDPEGDQLTFVSPSDLPTGATFKDNGNGTGTFSWIPAPSQIDAYLIRFEVSDGCGSDAQEILITVTDNGSENHPPILDPIGNHHVDPGQTLTFPVHATDPENNGLCLTLLPESLPDGIVFDSSCGNGSAFSQFSWTPDEAQAGTYFFAFTATDDGTPVRRDWEVVTITVGGDKPVLCPKVDSVETFLQPQEGEPVSATVFRPGQQVLIRAKVSNPHSERAQITPKLEINVKGTVEELAGDMIVLGPGNSREVEWLYRVNDNVDDIDISMAVSLDTDVQDCAATPPIAASFAVKTPIVILPGVMGSKLVDTSVSEDEPWNREVWPNVPRMTANEIPEICNDFKKKYFSLLSYELNLSRWAAKRYGVTNFDAISLTLANFTSNFLQWMTLNNDDYLLNLKLSIEGTPDTIKTIVAERVLKYDVEVFGSPIPKVSNEYFAGLEKYLKKNDYKEESDFYFFPYDWRLDIEIIAQSLATKIDEVISSTGSNKVRIVAHSMGGLVTKSYIINNPNNSKIKSVLLLGTPSLGASKIFLPLINGEIGSPSLDMFLNNDVIKEISRDFPPSYQVLPSQRYFQTIGAYFETDDPNNNYDVSAYVGMQEYLSANYNATLVAGAAAFHQSLEQWGSSHAGINTYLGAGCALGSPGLVHEKLGMVNPYPYDYLNGDETVPLLSVLEDDNAFDRRFLIHNVEHMALPSSDGAFMLLGRILKGELDSFANNITVSEYIDNAGACPLNEVEIIREDPCIEIEIIGTDYRISPDGLSFFVPNNGNYTIRVIGNSDGYLNLKLKLLSDAGSIKTVIYYNVPLPSGGIAELQPDVDLSQYEILIDADGDGTFETQVMPTEVLEGTGSDDIIPPVTTVELSGNQGSNDWFLSSAAIALNATDTGGSGLLNTRYRLDDDADFSDYSETFQITEPGEHTLTYYSIDRNLNTEVERSLTIKIDPQIPQVLSVNDSGEYDLGLADLSATITTSVGSSGLQEIQYSIGTAPGLGDIRDWTSGGIASQLNITDLTLVESCVDKVYVNARIFNGAGVTSEVVSSDGVIMLAPGGDPDADGFLNEAEIAAGSNPCNPDSIPKDTTITLTPGFNMIAIPADVTFRPDLRDWLPLLGTADDIETVMVYDPANSRYITLIPGGASNPAFQLSGGEGLIVYAKREHEIAFTSALCGPVDVRPGMNTIGFACAPDSTKAFALLLKLGSENAISIQHYDTETGKFQTAAFNDAGELNGEDFAIIPGEGYFLNMRNEVSAFELN